MIFFDEPLKSLWKEEEVFAEIEKLSQGAEEKDVYRNKEGRKTFRARINNKNYFIKHHKGVGWGEIIKNLLQFRLPVLGASNEFNAANVLSALGVDTLKPRAYGIRGGNPASRESFLVTDELENTTSLEDYCRNWPQQKPHLKIKQALIEKIAHSARIMHQAGINHRDFYICHFLLDNNAEQNMEQSQPFSCYLIDLHRCQHRDQVPYRWQVKDLGGLLYSTFDIGLTRQDYYRFVRLYSGKPLREALGDRLWRDVLGNAQRLYHKDFDRAPPVIF